MYFSQGEERELKVSVMFKRAQGRKMTSKLTKTRKRNSSAQPAKELKATVVLPYVKGLSEQLRQFP
ncbi:hypothetical protein pdam_00007041 [Pocillopora damicornis]|uniref:Uncharacterized protein n=1 Tax=Pocillopora damicornis TaxID=46731 RepID=A0A3M6T9C2_POCDA|nr:hypothetical protein pdam_00007041 [Pocillopora damicornis]